MSFAATYHSLALFRQLPLAEGEVGCWEPLADIYETATDVIVELELPGTRPGDVRILCTAQELVIEGVKGASVRQGLAAVARFLRVECAFGPFRRLIRLPQTVDRERGSARFQDGLLTVRLPKTPR